MITSNYLFVFAGQSNAARHFESYDAGVTGAVRFEETVDALTGLSSTQATLNTAVGASAAERDAQANLSGSNYWWDLDAGVAGPRLTQAIAAIQNTGTAPTAIIWAQGEQDAQSVGGNTPEQISLAEYRQATEAIFDFFRSALGDPDLPIFIQQLATTTNAAASPAFADVRYAQAELAAEKSNVFLAAPTYDIPLVDSFHFAGSGLPSDGYRIAGERLAHFVVDELGNAVQSTFVSPTILSASTQANDTQVVVQIAHGGGSDFTPSVDIEGFSLRDASGDVVPTSITRLDGDEILFSFAQALSGPVIVSYLDGASGFDLNDVVKDTGALTLPLAPAKVAANGVLFEEFNTETDGFSYVDDAFQANSNAAYASGQHSGLGGLGGTGALQINLGGIDGDDITDDMSGAFTRDFILASAGDVVVSFFFNLTIDGGYEPDEFSQVLYSIDGGAAVEVARLTGDGDGGPDMTTGFSQFVSQQISLTAGAHTLAIGGLNNKKTVASEETQIIIDEVTVTTVAPGAPNQPPTALDDPNGSTDEDSSVTIAVLANDSDPDLDPLTVTGVDTSGTQGQVSINPDGTIDYDPGAAFQFLNQGESATDSFTYSISDGRGGADSATVTVTVDGLDEPPGPISLEVEDMSLAGLTVETLAGVSSGDQHVRISDFGAPAGTTGTATATFTGASGTYDVILAYYDENDGQSTIDITVGDDSTQITLDQDLPGGGASAATRTEATVLNDVTLQNGDAITLLATLDPFEFARMDVLTFQATGGSPNQPPTALDDPNGSTDEDSPVTIAVLANDSDPDLDPLTVMGVDTSGTQGQVSINPDGTVDYDPGAAFQFLNQGESATDSFTYSISDGRGGADSATVTVTVDGLDEPPGPISLEVEDMSLAGLTVETLAGVSSGDQHVRISDFGAPAGTTGTASSVFTGASGTYDVILAYFDENDGQSTIDITIGDDSTSILLNQDLPGGGASAATRTEATVLSGVTINNGDAITLTGILDPFEFARMDVLTFQPTGGPPNQPPTANNDPNGSTDEDNPVTIAVLANDSDPDLDPLTVTGVDTTGTQGQVSVNPDGTVDYDPGAAFQFLGQGESATDSFAYSISDGRGGADSATVTVTVDGLDEPPGPISLEVEDMTLAGLTVETLAGVSSGDQHVRISDFGAPAGTTGTATATFTGPSGTYDVILAYFDENDGQSTIDITIGDDSTSILLDQDLPGGGASAATRTEATVLNDVTLQNGDAITLLATLDPFEFARMDVLTFQPDDPLIG